MKIGLYGFGFINKAIAHAFGNDNEILYYALDDNNCTREEMYKKSDVMFLGLPTPMKKKSGEIDLSIIYDVVKHIAEHNYKGIVVIKSTIVPGTCNDIVKKYPNIKLVFSPEFLTARSAKLDFINSSRIVLGGPKKYTDYMERFFRTRFKATPIFKTDYKTAEFIKYMCNIFFATKVIYLNTAYKIAKKMGIDWDMAIKGFLSDNRIGNSHYQVPGHDGDFGFGGYCFPKDLNAYINWLKKIGCKDEAFLFKYIWTLNLKYRKNRDWEKYESAVS